MPGVFDDVETRACIPVPINPDFFNLDCVLPYGLTPGHIHRAMVGFVDFFVNQQLHSRGVQRLECFLMPANFSSIVGEFMNISIPKYSS